MYVVDKLLASNQLQSETMSILLLLLQDNDYAPGVQPSLEFVIYQ
jgi:hypothetical protein